LLIISTVYKPTSGEVYVYGHDVIREGDVVRKYVGIAFQEPKALWVDKPYELLFGMLKSLATQHLKRGR